MNNRDFLLKILDSIDYLDDREAFVKEFGELISAQAMSDLISALPQDQQDLLRKELEANKDNQEKVSEILKNRFSVDQTQKALQETSQKMIEDWMREISPTLSDEQRQKLFKLSQELSPTTPSNA